MKKRNILCTKAISLLIIMAFVVSSFEGIAADVQTGGPNVFDYTNKIIIDEVKKVSTKSIFVETPNGLKVTGTKVNDINHPPTVQIDGVKVEADKNKWLIVSMSAQSGQYGGIYFTNSKDQKQYLTFPIIADNTMRTYNVFLGNYNIANKKLVSMFTGMVSSFSIIPTYDPISTGVVKSVEFSEGPKGDAFLISEYTGGAVSFFRVGRPDPIAIRIRNGGGTPIKGLKVEFSTKAPVQLVSDWRGVPDEILPDQAVTIFADILPIVDGYHDYSFKLTADNGVELKTSGYVRVEKKISDIPELKDIKQGEIPVPKPLVIPNYDLGMYYFSGWNHNNHWPAMVETVERTSPLGYYDESSPEGADWTIKWAVEHGIEYFNVLLYWKDGKPWNEKFLEKGLSKAKFLPYVKYFITWSNDINGALKPEDFDKFCMYVIDNYFGSPSYKLSEDGRPKLGLLSNYKMIASLGGEAALKDGMKKAEEYAKNKGFKGIQWIAGGGGTGSASEKGFEGGTYYAAPHYGANGYPASPSSSHLAAQIPIWTTLLPKTNVHPDYTQITVSVGFDHVSWWGKMSKLIRYGFNQTLFENHTRAAKEFSDKNNQRAILFESWNEYGEGSILSPNAEYGFQMLQTITTIFAPDAKMPPIVGPRDVGVYATEMPDIYTYVKKKPIETSLPERDVSELAKNYPSNKVSNIAGLKLINSVALFINSPTAIIKNNSAKIDEQNNEVTPLIKDGRTLVPVRFISEAFNAQVEWVESTKTVNIAKGGNLVTMVIGQDEILVNGNKVALDVPVQVINGRTMLPLRAFVESLNKKVFWDERGLILISDIDNILDTTNQKQYIDEIVSLFE